MAKIRVGIIFGGKSAEHEVSLMSAKNVIKALDPNKYETVLIAIDSQGHWRSLAQSKALLEAAPYSPFSSIQTTTHEVSVVPGNQGTSLISQNKSTQVDVIFPVLHGPYGEDGTIQGMLKLLNIPYVGPDVLASSVGMDKDVMKRLLRDAKIPVSPWVCIKSHEKEKFSYAEISKELGATLFVKPANMGSSVGVHKVTNDKEFREALNDAFQYDNKLLVEKQIVGREIECSVLGNENPIASLPGEVIIKAKEGWYSYDAKYIDADGAETKIPADLTKQTTERVQKTAIETYKALCCEGMSRVDMFVTAEDKMYVNEINTIPGFTNISMYPKMWEASGIKYSELIDKLIELAIARHTRDSKLKILKN